jgi:uncharacterized protein YxeA
MVTRFMKPIVTLLVLIILSSISFIPTSYSSTSWYVKVQTSQVKIIVSPYNSTDIISCLSNGKYIYAEVYELTCYQIANAIQQLWES